MSSHSTVSSCTHTTGTSPNRDLLCPICLESISPTSPTITHGPCLNSFHGPCFDSLVACSTDILLPNPQPTKCALCRGPMAPHPVLTCANSPETLALQAAIAETQRETPRIVPSQERQRIRDDAAATAAQNAAALRQQKAQATANAHAARQAQIAARQHLPSVARIRSLILARGILLGELMGRLVRPGMLPSTRAALQRRVVAAGRLEGATGRAMPWY